MTLPHKLKMIGMIVVMAVFGAQAVAVAQDLPQRQSPIPATTKGVPHVQLGVTPNPAISAELLALVAEIPGIEIRETVISLPGAKGFWINESVTIGRPEVIVGGREFAHMHPDGSLHASLAPQAARKAVERGWATPHPWANRRPGWEGFVMIYTPGTKQELDVVIDLVKGAYQFVTNGS